ncbi:MAG TPA: hypothetical protein PLQ13_03055, partial [Candidatus Krumholzibacteria bacterium]|nr:hypothetical protein [Candidatus Krumholzibacteria bacterium]
GRRSEAILAPRRRRVRRSLPGGVPEADECVVVHLRRSLPKVGARVATPRGDGVVRKLDLLGASVAVLVDGVDGLPVFRVADVTWSAGDALPKPRAGEPRGGCDGGCEGGCGRRPKDDA